MTSSPSVLRCLSIATVAVLATFALAALPVGTSPPLDPGSFLEWWTELGTPVATMTIARVAAVALALWTVMLFVGGAVVALWPSAALVTTWHRATPNLLRRLVAVGSVAVTASVPAIAGAVESPTPPEVTLVDLGAIDLGDETLPTLTDLGPMRPSARVERDARPPRPSAPAVDERWVVGPGDHLWRVAEETLRDHGHDPGEYEIARYWRRVIEANRDVIGDNPDLVRPGQVLILPVVVTLKAGS